MKVHAAKYRSCLKLPWVPGRLVLHMPMHSYLKVSAQAGFLMCSSHDAWQKKHLLVPQQYRSIVEIGQFIIAFAMACANGCSSKNMPNKTGTIKIKIV